MSNKGTEEFKSKWYTLREAYPGLEKCTYLDTSSCGLIARSTLEAADLEQQKLMENGSERFGWWMAEGTTSIREQVAANVGGTVNGLALVPKWSVGMAQLAQLLGHRPKVLLIDKDYPTLHAPFKLKGFEPIMLQPNADGTIPMELLASTIERERPQLVAISHVQWTTGFCIDLASVAALCKAHGAWSVIDITQSWCLSPVDVAAMGVDIIGASGYKWPLAGFGNGFMHVSEDVREEIKERAGIDPVVHLSAGHSDPVAFVRLGDALERVKEIGPSAINDRVNILCDHAVAQLDKAGVRILNGWERDTRAGILMIEGGEERMAQLQKANVQVAMRGAGIRVGIHFYNTEADIDRLVEALRR